MHKVGKKDYNYIRKQRQKNVIIYGRYSLNILYNVLIDAKYYTSRING